MNVEEIVFAPKIKRFGAFIIDFFIFFTIWYFLTKADLLKVDNLMQTLDPAEEGALDIFAEEIFALYVKFMLKMIFVKAAYYSLIPAIIGRGRTIGKLVFKINVVDVDTGEELSVLRLFLREIVGRGLIETLFIIPAVVSTLMCLFATDGRAIRDLLGKSVTVQQE